MDWRALRLLKILRDGKWHQKVNVNGIGLGTVMACVYLKLAEKELVPIDKNRWRAKFRITNKGKQVLKTSKGPTREEFTLARHHETCTTFFCRHRICI